MNMEQLQVEMDALVERHYYTQIRPETCAVIEADVQQLIWRWYTEGGLLLDRLERPIFDFEDVGIAVSISGHKVSISTYRQDRAQKSGTNVCPQNRDTY